MKRRQLITEEVHAVLPPLSTALDHPDPLARVRLVDPWLEWAWYVAGFDGDDVLFGLTDFGHRLEAGCFNLSELESLRMPSYARVERDLFFIPAQFSEIYRALLK